ncbi:unnamed protein product, partial [Discosporangium mesarthrocarpum]
TDNTIGGGWHLIGNPFAATVDWNAVSKSGVDAIGYVYSETGGSYTATNLLTDQNMLASFQGLFIHVNNSTNSITFSESDKTTGDAAFIRAMTYNRLRMSLTNVKNNKSVVAALDINEQASESFDTQFDAYQFDNGASFPSLYFKYDTIQMQVSTLPFKSLSQSVALYVENQTNDSLILKFDEIPEVDGCVKVYDKQEKIWIKADPNNSYTFWHTGTMPSDRFYIVTLDHLQEVLTEDVSCFEANDGSLEFDLYQTTGAWTLIHNRTDTVVSMNSISGYVKNLKSGYYELNWGGNNPGCKTLSKSFVINQPKQVIAKFEVPQVVSLNEVIRTVNTSSGADQYTWEVENKGQYTDEEVTLVFTELGKHDIVLTASKGDCEDES